MRNPALREEPRYQPAPVAPPTRQGTMLSWLESTGRLAAREVVPIEYAEDPEDLNDLMVGDDDYEIDEEEDDVMVEDDEL